ncbi:NAD-dependent succinate-semialdehyde dehydrogenase [Conexibacter stalactiti]|uniref:NAD-dependent succinate-semialdehyde dehydrogenase n=1 Tax=Conexibacter stalactiti TaxID=1940611 RepID=A0ABU4HID4_9ACTN|nr:NAD-dependent succinate-semialdehyde dehydrogenase [Conexibacter stalactiti]MDW5593072.1 NAD-dependent succinate-semialdehyde dehydrogenase [Conexibacter stalactiti]MEC5033713.1 NAD-dependent succinate-semialdehyde dehydrogenase [Conexibacter stalactiti]
MGTASDERRVLDSIPTQLHIGGEWVDGRHGETICVEDPATEEPLVDVASGDQDDALAALDAACAAQSQFAAMAPMARGEILRKAYEAMKERAEDLALLMTLEMGKPLDEARTEITYAADFLRYYAAEASRISGHYGASVSGTGRVLVMQQPVGPAILITPWNFPMAMGTRKVGPAIAAGCTMIWKPAAQTPLCALALTQIFEQAGLPPGVLNLVLAKSAGATMEPVILDGRARKLSFTGSTAVGRTLIAQAASNVLNVSMELGGNAPFLVFDDADLDTAVEGALLAKMRNIGQACVAANRFYVAEPMVEQFTTMLAARMRGLRLGRGTDVDVDVGPLIDDSQQRKVNDLVGDAVAKGGEAIVGGKIPDGRGYFFEPTVLANVPEHARLLKEEIFGPVAPISSFTSEEEAIAAANDTEFGLVAYVFTKDMTRAMRVCEHLQTGMVGLNQGVVSNVAAPFGGVKQSGLGREGGRWGIEEFLEPKYVAMNV